jgi:hypothetical protein
MKKLALTLGGMLILVGPTLAAPADRTFTGEIMDSACAAMGSHSAMMGKEGGSKACTTTCVKGGAKYVLYDSATKKTYQLDDQTRPEQFAGEKVKVMGTYDRASKTIHVTSIKSAS